MNMIREILVLEKGANVDHDGWRQLEDQIRVRAWKIRGEKKGKSQVDQGRKISDSRFVILFRDAGNWDCNFCLFF